MSILKLKPACKPYVWGGHRLVDDFNVEYDGEILAEAWELSCHPDGASTIVNGEFNGRTLRDYIELNGQEVLGENCRRFRDFPLLIKFIDAKRSLSIQVHPSNAYALEHEGQYGKTEFWYVIDAEPDAFIYYGFKHEISREEFARRIEQNNLLEVLKPVKVQRGDVILIESGTLHSIGAGILVAEIQQNSNVTYRVYDYGSDRELHIEKALEVTNRAPIVRKADAYPHIADCDYFTVDKLTLDGTRTYRMQGHVDRSSFLSILILDGHGTLSNQTEAFEYRKGDSFFLPAGSGDWQLEGVCDALLTTVRPKLNPIRVGVTIGSSEIQMGLVDENNRLMAVEKRATEPQRGADVIIKETARNILKLLEKHGIPLDQCVGVGAGVPGTIDRQLGKVMYSNNLRWENVSLMKELGKLIACPVRIANDADCAALGEAVAGAGRGVKDMVLLTLGNGLGSGIMLNGRLFEGGMIGGAEVGHQVISVNGRRCSCGRKGCLEAYVSVPALMSAARTALGRETTLEEIFERYDRGDADMVEVFEQYAVMLGQGVVNIVNMFRPQVILLGGVMSSYAERLIEPIEEMMRADCFGGEGSRLPTIAIAQLGDTAGIIGAANL